MKKAYLSMPADTPKGIVERLSNFICKEYSVDDLSFWLPGTKYSSSRLVSSDLVFSYIPPFQFEESDDRVGYMGKGQTNEYQIAGNNDQLFIVIDDEHNTYAIEHFVPNNYEDWKRKYTKFWLKKEDSNLEQPLTPEQCFESSLDEEDYLLL